MPTYFCLDFLLCTHFQTKVTFPNLCNLTSLPERVTVGVKWDIPCLVPESTTLPLLIWKARVSPADLFGLCPGWIQTHQPWHSKSTSFVPFFLKVQKTNLPHLGEMLEQTCSSFWVCRGGKTDYQAEKALWKLNSSIFVQNYPYNCQTNIRHKLKTHFSFIYEQRCFCKKVKGTVIHMHVR